MAYAYIQCEEEGAFSVITMRRPERRNALSEAHLRELLHSLREIAGSQQRGVVLAAEGPVFSAGHDFEDMDGRDLAAMRGLLGVCSEVMQLVQGLPQVVIAQVEGRVYDASLRTRMVNLRQSLINANPDLAVEAK